MENTKKRIFIYVMSFILPVVILCIAFFVNGFFGMRSFLTSNLELKIFPLFYYLKTIFSSSNDIFYSFSGLGNCFNVFAYYLFSPFNFLFYFISDKYIEVGITTLAVLKFGFCGLTFAYFLNKEFNEHYASILFACFYALCGYNVSNVSNIMFYDAIILLPLVILGLSRILKGEKSCLYFISLTLAIITNCVMGYVIAIFSVLFCGYKVAIAEKDNFLKIKSCCKEYFAETILAFGVTAWVWLPVFLRFCRAEYTFDGFFVIKTDLIMTMAKLFTSSGVNVVSDEFAKAPHIYVGVLAFAFVLLFFLNKKFSFREKFITTAFFAILYLFFSINGLLTFLNFCTDYSSFEGEPVLIASFLINFMLIYVAYKSFMEMDFLSGKDILAAGILYCTTAIVVMHFGGEVVDSGYVKFDMICLCCILYLLFAVKESKELIKSTIPLFVFVSLLNIGINTTNTFDDLQADHRMLPKEIFSRFYSDFRNKLTYIQEKDNSFYRTESDENISNEKWYRVYRNMPLLFGYNGITVYGNGFDRDLNEFYRYLGMSVYSNSRNHYGYDRNVTSLPYSLFGVKYVITSAEQMPLSYEKIYSSFGDDLLNIYENKFVFPIAFIVNNNEELYKPLGENNVFYTQNKILKDLANIDYGNVYDVHPFVEIEKVTVSEKFQPVDVKKTYKVDKKRDMFLSISDKNNMINYYEQVYKNDELLDYHIINKNAYFWLNKDKSENYFDLRFVKESADDWINYFIQEKFSVAVASENLDVLKKYRDVFVEKSCDIEKLSSSHLKITLNSSQNGQVLFLSVPFDKNWQFKVDGQKRLPEKVFGALTAIPLNSGDRILEMKYVSVEIRNGLIITILSLLLLLTGIFLPNRQEQ